MPENKKHRGGRPRTKKKLSATMKFMVVNQKFLPSDKSQGNLRKVRVFVR